MKKIFFLLTILLLSVSCEAQDKVNFSEAALQDTFTAEDGSTQTFGKILEGYKGQTVLIDLWATWCRDCIVGFPSLKALQEDNPEVITLFLSLDKTEKAWKNGIKKYKLEGDHYFLKKGWKSDFCDSIDLDWIPRYIVVNTEGKMSLFRAIKANDQRIKKILK